jgi:uncharacterized protein YqhQ
MAKFQYGGQALVEGVLMRGKTALAVALRHPDGSIVYATERLDLGLRARRAMKLPLMRGLVVLYDTLVTGTRWLVRSATLQAQAQLAVEEAAESAAKADTEAAKAAKKAARGGGAGGAASLLTLAVSPFIGACAAYSDPDSTSAGPADGTPPADPSLGKGWQVAVGGMLLLALALGIGIFFLLPLFLAQITIGRVDQGFGFQLTEGLIRVVIFMLYLMVIARAADVRRTFQYHGAEHQAIHALEAGEPLTPEAARSHPTAHPRCGTEFLVVVLIVSILAFALVGKLSPLWLIVSRIVLVPVIAAVSYEVLQFGARHRSRALVRWLWAPGIWVQAITTRQPTPDMNEVAIVSLQKALVGDGNEIPAGSSEFECRLLRPEDALPAEKADPAAREAGR